MDRSAVARTKTRPTPSEKCTSMSFLLRASLALSSSGSYPHSLATRWAVVVFPIPGGPEIKTALCEPIAYLPGRLKPVLRLASLDAAGEQRSAGSHSAEWGA